MSKFKKKLVETARKEREEQQKQELLRKKYHIEENVKVVEQDNIYTFTVRLMISLVRTIATIILVILAAIGLLALVYPQPRSDLLTLLNQVSDQLKIMIGI